MKDEEIKKIVKKRYKQSIENKKCCNCSSFNEKDIAKNIGYSEKELKLVPEANLGLGCGNPTALGEIKQGEVVLDLGSGAGIDCFLAAKKVGNSGKVIGVDMTEEMVNKSKKLAEKYGFNNVEFRLGEIDDLPIKDNSIDVIISNCVINLAPDKLKVFKEAYRVLKKDGRMYISDIVLLEQLSERQRNDEDLIAGCVGGALLKDDYLSIVKNAGFKFRIISEDKDISKKQYNGINLESLKLEAFK